MTAAVPGAPGGVAWPAYRRGLASGVGQLAFNVAVQLVMAPLYLSAFGKAEFGVLMLLLAALGWAAVGVLWMSGGMTRLFGELHAQGDAPRFAALYALAKWVNVGYAGLAWAAGFLLAPLFGIEDRAATLAACGLYFVALYSFSVDRVALNARGEQAASNLATVLSQAVFAALAVPALLAGAGMPWVFVCLAAGTVAGEAAARLSLRRAGLRLGWRPPAPALRRELWRRLVNRTAAGYVLFGLLTLTLQADALIVGWLGGAAAVAEFVLVWKIAEMAALVLARLPETLQPYLVHMDARGERADLSAAYARIRRLTWALAAAAALGYALLGPFVVRLWVGAEHAPDDRLAFALAGGAILWLAAARAPVALAFSTVRLRPLLRLLGVEFVAKLVLTLALFPRFGWVAPLLAINAVHLCGLAFAYARLGERVAAKR